MSGRDILKDVDKKAFAFQKLDGDRYRIEFWDGRTETMTGEEARERGILLVDINTSALIKLAQELQAQLTLTEKALELACEEVVAVDEGNCPGCSKNSIKFSPEGCSMPREKFRDCWRNYFVLKAEGAWKPGYKYER